MPHEKAKSIILKDRGTHFDPVCVDAFLKGEDQIIKVRERLSETAEESREPRETPAFQGAVTAGAPGQMKILVAEDEPVFALAKLKGTFGRDGLDGLYGGPMGEEAMKVIREHSPRVIVSDWVMPGMEGLELCKKDSGAYGWGAGCISSC